MTKQLISINTGAAVGSRLPTNVQAEVEALAKGNVTKADIGLANVDNTADTAKPVSTLQAAADTAVLNQALAAVQTASAVVDFGFVQSEIAIGTYGGFGTTDVNKVLQGMKDAGATSVRSIIWWGSVQGTVGGAITWAGLDQFFNLCGTYGLTPTVCLTSPAPASGTATAAAFGTFCGAVAARYGAAGTNQCHNWQIWNEANHANSSNPIPLGATNYAPWLAAAATAIRAADSQAVIILTSLASNVNASGTDVDPSDWLTTLYGVSGAKANFDAASFNYYSHNSGFSAWEEPVRAQYFYTELLALRTVMTSNADSAKSVHITEMGFPSHDVTDAATRGKWLAEQITLIRALPWVKRFFIYNYRDTDSSGSSATSYGQVDFTYTAKQPQLGLVASINAPVKAQPPDGIVTTAKLASKAVGTAQLADSSVGSTQIIDGSVGTAELAAASVGATNIIDGAVGTPEIGAAAVTMAKLASDVTAAIGSGGGGGGTPPYTQVIGDGSTTEFNLPHSFSTTALLVVLQYNDSTHQQATVTPTYPTKDTAHIGFRVAPTLNQFTVYVYKIGQSDITAPTQPTLTYAAGSATTNTIGVSAGGSTDDSGAPLRWVYLIDGVRQNSTPTSASTFTYSGLTPTTSYASRLSVIAVDRAGNESAVSTNTVTGAVTTTPANVGVDTIPTMVRVTSGIPTINFTIDGTKTNRRAWAMVEVSVSQDVSDLNFDLAKTLTSTNDGGWTFVTALPQGQFTSSRLGAILIFKKDNVAGGSHSLTPNISKTGVTINATAVSVLPLYNCDLTQSPTFVTQNGTSSAGLAISLTSVLSSSVTVCFSCFSANVLSSLAPAADTSAGSSVTGTGDYAAQQHQLGSVGANHNYTSTSTIVGAIGFEQKAA